MLSLREQIDELRKLGYGTAFGSSLRSADILIMRRPRMLNAGVDVNNYEPVTFDELLANNKAFQRRHVDTAKTNPFDLYCAEA